MENDINLFDKVEAMTAIVKAKEAKCFVAAGLMSGYITSHINAELESGDVIANVSVGKDIDLFKYWYNHK